MNNYIQLGYCANYVTDKIDSNELDINTYISTENLLQNKQGKTISAFLPTKNTRVTKYVHNDILIANIRPYLKKIWQADLIGGCSADVLVLRGKKDIDPNFLYYALLCDDFFDYVMKGVKGTRMPRGDKEQILNFQIPNLEYNIQKNIGQFLSLLDKKIEINNQINAELESMAKTLYDYWFVQFDFPDENGKPYKSSGGKMVYNSVLKREIPEGWNDGSLNDIGQIVGGSTPNTSEDQNYCKNGIPWITPNDLSNNRGNKFISRGNKDVSNLGMKSASLKKYPAGTILLSSRAPIGYMALARNEITTNQGFKSFIPNKGYASVFIYYSVLNSLKTIIQSSSGSTFKEISASVLKTIKIVLPAKNITLFFANNLASLLEKQNILEQENQNLVELRDFLLPMLMNGQVTIKE